MTGLFRMESFRGESAALVSPTTFSSDWDLHLEQLFRDEEIVSGLKMSLERFALRPEELNLASYQLDRIRSVPTPQIRMESHMTTQQGLVLRCEGILSSIWEAISKFFGWIADSISSLFGDDSEKSSSEDSSPSETTGKINEALAKTDKTIRTTEYNIAGMASILNMKSETDAVATVNQLNATIRNSPTVGKFLLNRVKELVSSKKGETAPDELKKLVEGIKGSDVTNLRDKLKTKPEGEYIVLFVDKKTALVLGRNGIEPLAETVPLIYEEEKAELNAESVAQIMRQAAFIPPLAADFRKHMLGEVKSQAKSLKDSVAKLPTEAKTEEERRFGVSMRIYAKVLRAYMTAAIKITKQGRTVARALDKTSECLKPYIKEKSSEAEKPAETNKPQPQKPENQGKPKKKGKK